MSTFQDPLFVDREKKYRGFQKLLLPATRQAVMLINAPEKMGKTWLALKLELHCKSPEVNVPVVRVNFRNRLDQLKVTDHLAFVRLLRDRLDEPDYFRNFNAVVNQLTLSPADQVAKSTGNKRRLAELAQRLQTVFDLNGLRRQAAFLEIEFENISGTTLFDKAYGMVLYFAQRGDLATLLEMLSEERSHIDWQGIYGDLTEAGAMDAASLGTAATDDALFKDRNAGYAGLGHQETSRAERLINEAFFDAIADLLRDRRQAVFLLDAYEQAPQIAADFITNQLLVRLLDQRLSNMVIVISGREVPDISDLGIKHLVVQTGLDAFNEQYVKDFMVSRNIAEDSQRWNLQSALTFSGGVPGILDLMADQAKMVLQDDDDFFD